MDYLLQVNNQTRHRIRVPGLAIKPTVTRDQRYPLKSVQKCALHMTYSNDSSLDYKLQCEF